MQERQIETPNAGRIHCRLDAATASDPWLILSNSLVTNLHIWDAQVEALKGQYNILRYDQRGHGQTPLADTPLNFDLLSDDALGVLDSFNVEKAVFVGLSMGVPTGLAAYEKAPERFSALVMTDGMAKTAPGGAAGWQERIDATLKSGMQGFADVTVERWLQADSLAGQAGDDLRQMIAQTAMDGFVGCARALQNYDYAHVAATLDLPVLAIAGAKDGAIPQTMQKAFLGSPKAQFAEIPEAGHVPNFERPAAFNQVLKAFLEGLPKG